MLQCQNYMLADQVSTLKSVAKKVAVKFAQAKYHKCPSKVNKKKVHLSIAKVEVEGRYCDDCDGRLIPPKIRDLSKL